MGNRARVAHLSECGKGNGLTPPHAAQGIPAPSQVADVAEEDATLHLTLSLLGGAKKRKKKARAARERGGMDAPGTGGAQASEKLGQNKKYLNGKWSYLFNATILGNEKGAEAPVRLYPGAPQSTAAPV